MDTQDRDTTCLPDTAQAPSGMNGVLVELFPKKEADKLDSGQPAASPACQRIKVLVVDDNRDAADSLHALFEMDGCNVATAYDGLEAVRAVEQEIPDLIIMDLGMPTMDGYEAARRIRLQPGSQSILMIALSGWGQGEARQRTIEAGFDHHLIKPVKYEELKKLATARFKRG
ncbi:response regulator [Massilia cavernae]|uniref:Response regulator n=1 Tax=Massilia cavernae TaxID=2320864 RepID=A0A418XFY5_9BURK|nr:response regulator [Massilia cavernae]RJG11369.1 response regulator [Massilia cavernae]